MKRSSIFTLTAIALCVIGGNAYAWPKCPDGSTSTINEQGKYVCPSPTPGGQPVVVTDTNTNTNGNSNVNEADAAAAAKAVADAIARAAATGGNADARAIGENWNRLTNEQQQALNAQLSASQRAVLNSVMQTYNPSTATATLDRSGNGGGAQVTTNNTSNNKVLQVNLPTPPAVAPTVAVANGITIQGTCGPLKEVESIPVEYLLVGLSGMDKVQLSGQTTERLVPMKDADGRIKKFDIVDNGDGTKSEVGTIASEAIVMVSGSTSKQFGFGIVGGSGGGNASNGSSGSVVITQRIIVTGSCVFRHYREVPLVSQNAAGAPTIAGLTKEDLLASEARIAEALQRAALSAKVEVAIPEREWVNCPDKGCDAPKKGYYRYKERKASAEAAATLKQEAKK